MSTPVPPQGQPTAYEPAYANAPAPQQQAPARKSKAPWVIGIVIIAFVLLSLCACMIAPVVMMSRSTGSSGLPTFGDNIGIINFSESIAATSGMTPKRMRDMLQAAEDDPNIKAVVVRVDSPGGTVAASQEISTYVKRFSKPIVFSVGDICASGAYMAASQSDHIMAMPMSGTGSIGVIMTTLNLEGLFEDLGIEMGSIVSTEGKDAGAIYRELTDEERKFFQDQISELNSMFIQMVAEGRDLSYEEVEKYATGQVYYGNEALQGGLIDSMGTYDDAVKKAAELADIDPESVTEVSLDFIGIPPFSLGSLFGVSSELAGERFAEGFSRGLTKEMDASGAALAR